MFDFLKSSASPGQSASSSLTKREKTLLGLFESFASSSTTSKNIALCTEAGSQLSYKELNDKATELSSQINSHITPDGRPHLVGKQRTALPLYFHEIAASSFVPHYLTPI